MEKIKRPFQDFSLRKSIIIYMTVFAVAGVLLSTFTDSFCDIERTRIIESYPASGEKYYLTTEDGIQLGEGTYIVSEERCLSKEDERLICILELLPIIATPLYSASCITAAALLFYRNRLKKPLAELRAASEKIIKNDLNFSLEYNKKDELGRLCASFELMRTMLANNFSLMWRQVEDRKQLNAAFAHDLRTPLTVLKGYNEMLQASGFEQVKETAATMGRHIARMETYVNSMSNLRRLEDMQPECKTVSPQLLLSSLRQNTEIVCEKNCKALKVQNEVLVPQLSIDTQFVSQVCNNLVANAARYARTSIMLSFSMHDSGLLLSVTDDGKGFDKSCLNQATHPYFSKEADRSKHFGLGLYICKLLCEHHGGYLRIENTINGAKVSAFFKTFDL